MKTKNKYLMGVLALSVALVSCTSEKVETSELIVDSGSISFSSYATISRGLPINGNSDFESSSNDFGVTAYISSSSTSPYMGASDEGAHIVYSSGWDYETSSDSRYWPTTGETLNFYAYSPHDGTNRGGTLSVSSDDLTIESYSVPTLITSQEDFMYASETGVTSTSDNVSGGTLTLSFSHALTQVNFTVSTAQSNLWLDIQSIAIGNINSVADFSISSGWSEFETPALYYANIVSGTVIGNTAVDLTTSSDDILMLIPQTFSAWNGYDNLLSGSSTGGYILISCKLYNTTDGVNTYHIGDADNYVQTALPVSSDAAAWSAGSKVTYNIVFASDSSSSGGGGYDPEGDTDTETPVPMIYPITFTASLEDWDDGVAGSLNM